MSSITHALVNFTMKIYYCDVVKAGEIICMPLLCTVTVLLEYIDIHPIMGIMHYAWCFTPQLARTAYPVLLIGTNGPNSLCIALVKLPSLLGDAKVND